jgi:hypothetical protein
MGDFDINEGAPVKGRVMLPSAGSAAMGAGMSGMVSDVESYAAIFETQYARAMDASDAAAKSIAVPPGMLSFGKISYMPESYNSGVLQWPGIAPEALRKTVRENLAPQLIIGMRCDDVIRFSQYSTHPWKPGWRIEPMNSEAAPSVSDKKDIQEVIRFLSNSSIDTTYAQANERDERKLTNFQRFLSAMTRDTLTFDGIAVWKDVDQSGKVKAYSLLPAGNIRLVGPDGYLGNKDIAYVAVDEGNKIIHEFTREELTFYIRNPRPDAESLGYGYPEIEIAMRLVQGIQNAIDLNCDTFNKNSTPNGILVLSGSSVTQRQLDLLNRMWTNLKKGITKAWALPVMGLADGSKLEVVDMTRLKGNEVYYRDFLNMFFGAFATVYRFPVKRIGYKISGQGRDNEPNQDAATEMDDSDDPGLAPLLIHIENVINEYLVWTRWPHLRFTFIGKNPKEEMRGFEFRKNAMTFGEARSLGDLDDLENEAKGEDEKLIARIMNMAPLDPNMSGVFQSVAAAFIAAKFGAKPEGGDKGNTMTSKIDPARSADHGAEAGVRRDSAAETKKE